MIDRSCFERKWITNKQFDKIWEKIPQQIEKIRSHAWVKVIEGE